MISVRKIFLIITCLVFSVSAYATVEQEKDMLARLQQLLEIHSVAIEDIENDIYVFDAKLPEAKKDAEDAQAQLQNAKSDLTEARKQLTANRNDDTLRALKLVTHSHKIAQRGARSRSKRLERIELKLAELKKELSKETIAIDSVKQRLAAQQQRIEQAIAFQERRASEEALRKARKVTSAVNHKQQVQHQRSQEKRIQNPADQKLAERSRVQKKVIDAPKPRAQVNAIKSAAPAPAVAKTLSKEDAEALEYAQKEVTRLEKLLADGNKGKPTFRRLVLKGDKIASVSFEFLGKNQYIAETEVKAGSQLFKVGNHRFRRTIPSSDSGEIYVFIFDAKRLQRPRFVSYKKSLIQ